MFYTQRMKKKREGTEEEEIGRNRRREKEGKYKRLQLET